MGYVISRVIGDVITHILVVLFNYRIVCFIISDFHQD